MDPNTEPQLWHFPGRSAEASDKVQDAFEHRQEEGSSVATRGDLTADERSGQMRSPRDDHHVIHTPVSANPTLSLMLG